MALDRKQGEIAAVMAGMLLATVMLATPATVSAAAIAWEGIEDPHIRAAQFDLLLGDPFAAITQLKADLQQGRIHQRPEQAQLALGGMYLAYGAHYKAAEIFAKLGESGQSQEVRNLAWQQLAQVQYQRGLADEALAALGRIQGELPVEEQQERLLLEGMLLMDRQRFDEAITVLRQLGKKSLVQQLSEKSVWATYGRFNLGVALFQQGNEKEGRQLLEELGAAEADSAEGQALRDKANLTLAYHALSQEDPDLAQRYFIKTRLQGPLSNKALLGLGRAYSAKASYKEALVPWLKLIKGDTSDAAVQDGLLAVPFAFGKLDAYKQALQYYQSALASFKNEMEQVRLAETAINSGVLVDSLARTVGAQDAKDRWLLQQLPDNAGGRYLWPLFATNEFQETLKNYAQMRLSLGRLEQWSSEIDDSKGMAPQQRRQLETRIGQLQGKLVAMVERLRNHLQSLALKELARRKQRLVGYAGEARFSMAQIYDYAAKRWGGGR
jgi:hypothetical protein